MKKFLCGLLTLATVMPLAVACGGGGGGNDTGDGLTLEIRAIDKGLGTQWLQQAASDYMFLNEGAKITVIPDETLHSGIDEKLRGKRRESDIYFTFSSEKQWVEWYARKYIVDLEDIKTDIVYRDTEYAKLGMYDGKRVIMPYCYPPTGFIYNQNYINEIPSNGAFTKGTFPTTWQGLLDMCDSIKNNWKKVNNGQTVLPMAYGGAVGDIEYIFKGLWAQIDPAGFKAYWNQEKRDNVSNDENKGLLVNNSVKQAMESIVKLIAPEDNGSGYCPSNAATDATTWDNLRAQQAFLNGNAVFTISGAWFENEMKTQIEQKWDNPADRFYHFAPAPIVNAGGQSTVFINSPSEYFLIANNGKNRNVTLAKEFLKFLAEPDQAQIFHKMTGTPCAVEYDVPNNLTVFQSEIANVAETAVPAIGASDQIPSLSGILKVNFNRVFSELATAQFSQDTIATKLEGLYSAQKRDWSDYISQF